MELIEVAYATPEEQVLVQVQLPAGATVRDAIVASGILERFGQIDLASATLGIFSRPCTLDDTVRDGDRVEIYRPLVMDPKEARRKRAARRT